MLDLDAFDRLCLIKDAEKLMQETPADELDQPAEIKYDELSELAQNALKHDLKREMVEEPELKWHADLVDKEGMQEELYRAVHLDRVKELTPERDFIPDCDLLMDQLDQQMEEIALRRVRETMEQEDLERRVAMLAAALLVCISILRELSYW